MLFSPFPFFAISSFPNIKMCVPQAVTRMADESHCPQGAPLGAQAATQSALSWALPFATNLRVFWSPPITQGGSARKHHVRASPLCFGRAVVLLAGLLQFNFSKEEALKDAML